MCVCIRQYQCISLWVLIVQPKVARVAVEGEDVRMAVALAEQHGVDTSASTMGLNVGLELTQTLTWINSQL